jgi:putative flippase GtrA
MSLLSPTNRFMVQVPRALVASVLAAALDFGLLAGLVEILRVPPTAAAVVSYLAGGVLQYWLCSVWVFPASPGNVVIGFTAFTILSLGGLAITWLCMYGLHDLLAFHYTLAKCAALGCAFWWNFLSRKYLLFGPAFTKRLPVQSGQQCIGPGSATVLRN